jgi:peptide/nickel transport system substrate-binding protein
MVVPLMSVVGASSANANTNRITNQATSFPRNETLYTSGTSYSPPTNFNPNDPGALYQMGTNGLLYESLFLYDPIHNKYIPWLATSATWSGDTYTIHVRNGVDWVSSPSQSVVGALTGADVAFTINMEKADAASAFNSNMSSVKSATANGNTVTVTFDGTPDYTSFQEWLWKGAIFPQSVFASESVAEQETGSNTDPVSTGAMTLDTTTATQACFETNPHWWGTAQLGLSFKFKYLCDSVNGSNNVELSSLLSNDLDWSNNFLPGINTLKVIGGDSFIQTYYPKSPYMLSANTAWLEPNTTKAPMNNVNFRKALAYGINPEGVVSGVYSGIVKAANPTGLMPNLDSYISASVVKQYGFSYNPTLAKQYLAKSGYKGQTLTLEVPDGWTDWMAAIQDISSQLNAIGIKVEPIYPQDSARNADLTNGTYDLAIDNNASIDSNPYAYFQRVYNLPILKQQNAQLNWERYSDPAAWALVQKASTIALTDTSALDKIYAQIETDFLQTLPEIPLWYNGAWFQGNNTYWTGFPSSANPNDQYTPVMWNQYLNMTTIEALAQLKPV